MGSRKNYSTALCYCTVVQYREYILCIGATATACITVGDGAMVGEPQLDEHSTVLWYVLVRVLYRGTVVALRMPSDSLKFVYNAL